MTDLSFLAAPAPAAGFVAETRPRANGAGIDLYEYDRVTAPLTSLLDWPDACRAAALRHRAEAERAAGQGRVRNAGLRHRSAARWFHLAALIPDPDRGRAAVLAAEADRSMGDALALLEPQARRVAGEGFAGWLRLPDPAEGKRFPVVVVIPGMDSGKEEFHRVGEALLARGLAVLAIDGPGQGVLAASTVLGPDHRLAVARALDALGASGTPDASGTPGTSGMSGTSGVADRSGTSCAPLDLDRIAVLGLSLGGYLAADAAAHDPRIRATAMVSAPYRLDPDALVPFVTATLAQRCGGAPAARAFAAQLDLAARAPRLTAPLLLVEGGQDRIPGVTNAIVLADDPQAVPHAEVLHVPHGNHLLGNALADWLPDTADWLAERLLTPPRPTEAVPPQAGPDGS